MIYLVFIKGHSCGSAGIGRQARLRIWWSLRSCGFKSHLPHKKSSSIKIDELFVYLGSDPETLGSDPEILYNSFVDHLIPKMNLLYARFLLFVKIKTQKIACRQPIVLQIL